MPLVNPAGLPQIFWDTTEVLNFARVLVNDAQGSLAGQDLSDERPYTWTLLNLCYANLANWLEDNNVESATYAEAIITLPPTGSYTDPSAQAHLAYGGYTDAAGNSWDSPTLPDDLLEPLQLWQRPSGQNVPFAPMTQRLGGLAFQIGGSIYGYLNNTWEFRQNAIYFVGGAYVNTDIRIRYVPSFPTLTQPTGTQAAPQIYFARAGEALAYMVAATFLEIRSAKNAPLMRARADEQLNIIARKAAKRSNQTQTRRKGYGFGRRRRTCL